MESSIQGLTRKKCINVKNIRVKLIYVYQKYIHIFCFTLSIFIFLQPTSVQFEKIYTYLRTKLFILIILPNIFLSSEINWILPDTAFNLIQH